MLCGIPWQKKKGEDAMSDGVVRRPTHAGSWYTDRGEELEASFRRWMDAARVGEGPVPRAIIGPHAGYSYCGHVGAYCYKALLRAEPKRVFLLGPSHHYFTRRCCLSGATSYDTPVGSMKIDQAVYAELHKTGLFDVMPLDVDEAEHSLELHAPYIRHTFSNRDFLLVPIMVGSLSPDAEAQYGRALAPYLSDPANVFVISSDFCHWGRRFAYTPYDKGQGDICDAIEAMDKRWAWVERGRACPMCKSSRGFACEWPAMTCCSRPRVAAPRPSSHAQGHGRHHDAAAGRLHVVFARDQEHDMRPPPHRRAPTDAEVACGVRGGCLPRRMAQVRPVQPVPVHVGL